MSSTDPSPPDVHVVLYASRSRENTENRETTQQIDFPERSEPTSRTVRVELAPSVAGTIFAALQYLTSYPYGCTEQTMSSFLPDVLVSDALKKLGVKSNVDPAVRARTGCDASRATRISAIFAAITGVAPDFAASRTRVITLPGGTLA